MADTELQFRTATFGGFQKQDVLLYIETMTREHREKLDGLQRKLDEAGEAQSARGGELAAAREREEKLGQELQGLREELSAALDIPFDQVGEYITQQIEQLKQTS